jgi:hypothetical protein
MNIEQERLEALEILYYSNIENLIDKDQRFFRFQGKPKFDFFQNEDIRIFGKQKNNVIFLNIFAIDEAYRRKASDEVEYFLLHEIRHLFQHEEVFCLNNNSEIAIGSDIIRKWDYEFSHYSPATDEKGNASQAYAKQDCEIDAYAFAYGVMKYKGKDVDKLFLPPESKIEILKMSEEWVKQFKSENI